MIIDYTTDVGRVRLLITDIPEGADPIFSDEQIEAFLAMNGSYVKLAAAAACDVIARSELLVAKVITSQDVSTDGAKVAAEMRALAKALRDDHAADIDAGNLLADDGAYTVLQPSLCGPEAAVHGFPIGSVY